MSKNALKMLVPLLLIAVFMVSTFSAVADSGTSSDSKDNGVSSQQENEDSRQVQVQFDNSTNQVQIQSENQVNGTSSHIEAEIAQDEGLTVAFSYSGNVNHTESELHIQLRATKLVEFINSNTAIPGYDLNDTLLNTFNLKNSTWVFAVGNSTVGTVSTYSVNATATLSNNAQVQFQFLMTNTYALQSNGNTLAPNALKWSVVISNYPYASSQSQLALQTTLKSGTDRSGFQSDHYSNSTEDVRDGLTHNNESAVNFGNTSSTGFFSWSDSYTADGHNESVVTSPSLSVDTEDSTGNTNQMYFSFVQGKIINWDPKVGVSLATSSAYMVQHPNALLSVSQSAPATTSASSAPGFEAVVFLMSFGVMAVIVNKKRRN